MRSAVMDRDVMSSVDPARSQEHRHYENSPVDEIGVGRVTVNVNPNATRNADKTTHSKGALRNKDLFRNKKGLSIEGV